ncbi:MAG: CHAD domain-containing protein, partial [Planctomycetales bacterium]|nr:CHAD domain-containing protein [Planctomycetales bacterium]
DTGFFMPPAKKWLSKLNPETPVGQAAQWVMGERLLAVGHYVPLAALRSGDDVEYVHQLRVWTRRAATAWTVFCEQLPPKRVDWLKKQLDRCRRAAGPARDDDVLLMHLRKQFRETGDKSLKVLLSQLAEHRRETQRPLEKLLFRWKKKDVFARCERLVGKTRWRGKNHEPGFAMFARPQLLEASDHFFTAAAGDLSDAQRLHALRIAGKRLRYAIEIFAPAFPSSLRQCVYPQVEQLQGLLGAVNDHAVAQQRFLAWREQTTKTSVQRTLGQLVAQEQGQFAASRREFFQWWTESRCRAMRKKIAACTQSENGPATYSA